jgi:hypothetical protein
VIPYVCLPGCGYTGSTLLGFLLNAHPECASIGAATGLVARVDLPSYRCSCGALFGECGFWRAVAARTRELGHPVDVYKTGFWSTHFTWTGNRVLDALLFRSLRAPALTALRDALLADLPPVRAHLLAVAATSAAFARAVLEQTGKRVFVDTARDHQRPKLLARSPELDVRVIHLVRDARANSASIMKRLGLDAAAAARHWEKANLEAERTRRYFAPERWLRVRYDELCSDLQATLDRISDFLGVRRAPAPADFRAGAHHVIGNEMRLEGAGQVREDVSWRERLSASDLDAIARNAGRTNRFFGFDWPDAARS